MSPAAAIPDLMARVIRRLTERGIAHRLIGASALAVHGVARSTHDVDLLATDPAALDRTVWEGVTPPGFTVDVRRGDDTDPLLGIVRIEEEIDDDRDWETPPLGVDIVLVRGAWAARMTSSAGPVARFGEVEVQSVDAADLVLLKLYAGGPRDGWDVAALLEALGPGRGQVVARVDAAVGELPRRCARTWRRIRDDVIVRRPR